MITFEQIEQLDFAWEIDEGFLGKLRSGIFDRNLHEGYIHLLQSISLEEDELIPRRVVSCLWYVPLFMQWQSERVVKSVDSKEYERKITEIVNELERILGAP